MTLKKRPKKTSQKEPFEKVGILGGGQLGCMLADAAIALDLDPRIFAEASSPAAALFADRTALGSLEDETALRAFFKGLTVVVFENEFLDCDLLERARSGLETRFSPELPTLRELQDKLRQKQLLGSLHLPTAEFVTILPGDGSTKAIEHAYAHFQGQVVFKWSRLGYDGKGVCLAEDSPEGRKKAIEFCDNSLLRGVPVYAERKIAFRQELAMIACRSMNGDFAAYPLVVSEQERGICKRVYGPATALGITPALEAQATHAARTLAHATRLEGSFALELFVTENGELSINEIAPRVHNSGHYTQEACSADQFENHWRAALGLELGDTRTSAGFGMLNLLGPEKVSLSLPRRRTGLPFPETTPPLKLHWYAKAEIRPWRKVGHVNGLAPDAQSIAQLRQELDRFHTEWIESLSKLQKPDPQARIP